MLNPLIKRVPKELKEEWGKYLVIFLFLATAIGFISGTNVANNSMLKSIDEARHKYNQEDGHFIMKKQLSRDLYKNLEDKGIKIYENFYKELDEDNDLDGEKDGAVRLYTDQKKINRSCILNGHLPAADDEIAIDRMHADNVRVKVGDRIKIGRRKYKISGLIARADYSTLFKKNGEVMFNAIEFNVAVIRKSEFDNINARKHYDYAWKYDKSPKGKYKEKKRADELMKNIFVLASAEGNEPIDFVPSYISRSINFAHDDIGSDKEMANYLLYVLTVVFAFIFAITISGTIEKESSVIGTLRTLGYTKREIMFHYMSPPIIITVLAAAAGNILGYTVCKEKIVYLYYNSYSLPSYKTLWNSQAFYSTTIVPIVLMILINAISILWKLRLSPNQLLRHDFKRKNKKKAIMLPHFDFVKRFRLRIFLQNIPGYFVLFSGLLFTLIMMTFAAGFPSTLNYYQDHVAEQLFSKYQYVLNSEFTDNGEIVSTDTEGAEKYSMKTMNTYDKNCRQESVAVYGVKNNSRYLRIPNEPGDNKAYISSAYRDKFGYKTGDKIYFKEKYQNKKYSVKVAGYVKNIGNIAVFMSSNNFNKIFDMANTDFSGYFSDKKIKDIEGKYIEEVITENDVTKVVRQLEHSMGDYMDYYNYICVVLSALLMYLITKTIIEKNEKPISIIKILGYYNHEIASLYIVVSAIFVAIAEIICLPVAELVVKKIWISLLEKEIDGWLPFYLNIKGYVKMFVEVYIAYIVISVFDFIRIKKIPMDKILKNVE